MEYYINKNEEGTRIDKVIADKNKKVSRQTIQRWIEDGLLKVNEKTIKSSYKVNEGDKIEIKVEQPKEIKLRAQEIPLDIIYEDRDIIVVNKAK